MVHEDLDRAIGPQLERETRPRARAHGRGNRDGSLDAEGPEYQCHLVSPAGVEVAAGVRDANFLSTRLGLKERYLLKDSRSRLPLSRATVEAWAYPDYADLRIVGGAANLPLAGYINPQILPKNQDFLQHRRVYTVT